jgi:hypothetical protein
VSQVLQLRAQELEVEIDVVGDQQFHELRPCPGVL